MNATHAALAERFTPEQIESMTPYGRGRWALHVMIDRVETHRLLDMLGVLTDTPTVGEDPSEDGDAQRLVQHTLELVLECRIGDDAEAAYYDGLAAFEGTHQDLARRTHESLTALAAAGRIREVSRHH